MKKSSKAKSLRWTANMLGGTEQEKGFPRTAAFYCIAGADQIDELQKAFALACRIISDNLPVCLPDNQSWQNHILERVRTEPVCRACGCTEDNACTGGCYWWNLIYAARVRRRFCGEVQTRRLHRQWLL